MTTPDSIGGSEAGWQQPYADAGHDVESVFSGPEYSCKRCGAAQIDLSEDLVYGQMRKCHVDQLAKDMGRKCADDVSAAIRRNMQLMPDRHGKMVVSTYAAAAAIGAANGAFAAMAEGPLEIDEAFVDQCWSEILRPMILGQIGGRS